MCVSRFLVRWFLAFRCGFYCAMTTRTPFAASSQRGEGFLRAPKTFARTTFSAAGCTQRDARVSESVAKIENDGHGFLPHRLKPLSMTKSRGVGKRLANPKSDPATAGRKPQPRYQVRALRSVPRGKPKIHQTQAMHYGRMLGISPRLDFAVWLEFPRGAPGTVFAAALFRRAALYDTAAAKEILAG